METINSKLLLPIIVRKRKFDDIADEADKAVESAPRKKLKTCSSHNNSTAELHGTAPEGEDSSDLEELSASPECPSSRSNSSAEPRDSVAKPHQSPQLEQLNSVSKDGTNHDNSRAQLHDAAAENEQPQQLENLHPGLTSNTHHSNSAAHFHGSVGDKQPQQLEQLSTVFNKITENSDAAIQPPDIVMKDRQSQRQEQLTSVSDHNATHSNSAVHVHDTVQKVQPQQQEQLASVSQHNVTHNSAFVRTKAAHSNTTPHTRATQGDTGLRTTVLRAMHAQTKRVRSNNAAQAKSIQSNAVVQSKRVRSNKPAQADNTLSDIAVQINGIESNIIGQNQGTESTSDTQTNETAMPCEQLQQPTKLNPDPRYEIPAIQSNDSSNLDALVYGASPYRQVSKILGIVKEDADIIRLFEGVKLARELKKANFEISAALNLPGTVVENPATTRDKKFLTPGHIRDYGRTTPAYKPNFLGLPVHIQCIIFRKVLEEPREICPQYCRGYQPAEPEYSRQELRVMKKTEHGSLSKFCGSNNIDLPNLFFVNKHFHTICSQIFYSTNVFIFNDARSCVWFLRKLDETKVQQIKNVVFNISSGFFLSKELRGKYDVCEEERWCQIFLWLRTRHCFQNCLIRFYSLKTFKASDKDKLSEEDMRQIHDNRVHLPFYLSQLRGIQKVRIENHHCNFLAHQEMYDVVKAMTLPDGVGLDKYRKLGPQGDALMRHEAGARENFSPKTRPKIGEAPVNTAEAPVNAEEAPVNAEEALVSVEEASVSGEETPVNVEESPVSDEESSDLLELQIES